MGMLSARSAQAAASNAFAEGSVSAASQFQQKFQSYDFNPSVQFGSAAVSTTAYNILPIDTFAFSWAEASKRPFRNAFGMMS